MKYTKEVNALCDAISILVATGIVDYNGHVSLRLESDSFLINSGPSNRRQMTPDQVGRIAPSGEILEGQRPPNEVALHSAILKARPDVRAVVHGHPKWSTIFTACGLSAPVVMPQGSLVADLPLYPQSHSISSEARGEAVAAMLGQGAGLLLKSHGSVLVGTTLAEAVCRAIYLEQNAERAYMAQHLGRSAPLAAADQAEYRKTLASDALYQKCWTYYSPRGGTDNVW